MSRMPRMPRMPRPVRTDSDDPGERRQRHAIRPTVGALPEQHCQSDGDQHDRDDPDPCVKAEAASVSPALRRRFEQHELEDAGPAQENDRLRVERARYSSTVMFGLPTTRRRLRDRFASWKLAIAPRLSADSMPPGSRTPPRTGPGEGLRGSPGRSSQGKSSENVTPSRFSAHESGLSLIARGGCNPNI